MRWGCAGLVGLLAMLLVPALVPYEYLHAFLFYPIGNPTPVEYYIGLGEDNFWNDDSTFLNMGYWTPNTRTIDEASLNLVALTASRAEVSCDDDLLDLGFGFGDQDFFLLDKASQSTFKRYWDFDAPRSVIALDVTPIHVERARERALSAGTANLQFTLGDATALPLQDETVSKVLAVESAFHFDTRERAFREAFRVLKPGGRVAFADILFDEELGWSRNRNSSRLTAWARYLMSHYMIRNWGYPAENRYGINEYENMLGSLGFVDVRIESINSEVWEPAFSYLNTQSSRIRTENSPVSLFFRYWHLVGAQFWDFTEYVLVSAKKPELIKSAWTN